MSRVFSVRLPDDVADAVDEHGGSAWIREQVVALIAPATTETPEPEEPRGETMEFEGKELPVVHKCSWTEEQYVAKMLTHPDLIDRARAKTYVHWRYRGFMTGQIASL